MMMMMIIIIIIIIIIIHSELFTSVLADGFNWSLSNSKSPQVSRTLLSILAVLSNAVVWMVSTCPPNSKSSCPFSNPLVTVPNALIGIIVTVFSILKQVRGTYPSFHILSILFCGQPGQQSRQFCKFSFFLLIIKSVLLAEIK